MPFNLYEKKCPYVTANPRDEDKAGPTSRHQPSCPVRVRSVLLCNTDQRQWRWPGRQTAFSQLFYSVYQTATLWQYTKMASSGLCPQTSSGKEKDKVWTLKLYQGATQLDDFRLGRYQKISPKNRYFPCQPLWYIIND